MKYNFTTKLLIKSDGRLNALKTESVFEATYL